MNRFFKKNIWNMGFFIIFFVLVATVFVSFLNQREVYRPILGVVLISAVLLSLFFLEGMQVAISSLKNVSYGDLEEAISSSDHLKHKDEILLLHKETRESFDVFVTGQQVLITLLLILFDKILPLFSFTSRNTFVVSLDALHNGLGKVATEVLTGHITDYIITAFLLCWLTQLAPGFIADKSSFAFLKTRFSKKILLPVIKYLGNSGAGAPGNAIKNAVKLFPLFRREDNIRTGPSTVFNFESSRFGFFAKARNIEINISEDETLINEETEYVFIRNELSEKHQSRILQHAIMIDKKKVSSSTVSSFSWSIKKPNDLVHGRDTIFSINLFSYENKKIENLLPEEEMFIYLGMSFEEPLPREQYEKETIIIAATYKLEPVNLTSGIRDIFSFEIAKPTGEIRFKINKSDQRVMLPQPNVLSLAMDEIYNRDVYPVLRQLDCKFTRTSSNGLTCYEGRLAYPLLSSRVVLILDANKPE